MPDETPAAAPAPVAAARKRKAAPKKARAKTAAPVTSGQHRIVKMALSDAVKRFWPGNPKQHAEDLIEEALGEFGLAELPMLDETTGKWAAGNGRIKQLADMKAAGGKPPARIDARGGEWFVPVIRGVSFHKAGGKYVLASNRVAERGGWSRELLPRFLRKHKADLVGTGFGDRDVVTFLARRRDGAAPELKQSFSIIIECKNERHQTQLLARLQRDGLKVKALIT